jgi:hypothetical protein
MTRGAEFGADSRNGSVRDVSILGGGALRVNRGAVMEAGSGRSKPSPRPGLSSIVAGLAWLETTDDDDSIEGKFPSDKEASIDPNASSTSGKDMMDEIEDELDMLCSDGWMDCSDDSEGKEGYDSKGGEGGSDPSGRYSSSSESSNGRSTVGLNGEKSSVSSIAGAKLILGSDSDAISSTS